MSHYTTAGIGLEYPHCIPKRKSYPITRVSPNAGESSAVANLFPDELRSVRSTYRHDLALAPLFDRFSGYYDAAMTAKFLGLQLRANTETSPDQNARIGNVIVEIQAFRDYFAGDTSGTDGGLTRGICTVFEAIGNLAQLYDRTTPNWFWDAPASLTGRSATGAPARVPTWLRVLDEMNYRHPKKSRPWCADVLWHDVPRAMFALLQRWESPKSLEFRRWVAVELLDDMLAIVPVLLHATPKPSWQDQS